MEFAPTERELEILTVLWTIGEASVRQVHEQLVDESGLHFNTIQTQLRIMDQKGLVASRPQGRALLYRPLYTRRQVTSRFLKKLFGRMKSDLVLNMLGNERLTAKQIAELESILAESKSATAKKKGRKDRP